MMIQTQCDQDRLLAFISNQLTSDAEAALIAHLDTCESCGIRLEHQVAPLSSWREASDLLGEIHRCSNVNVRVEDNIQQTLQVEQILSQLGPSDDETSLGRIAGCEVTGVIGSGGMGVVLKARDKSLDRIVAIKVMAPHLAASGSARQRFAREAKAAAAVLHPNVIAIHGVSNDQSLPYLIMPYVRGVSLQRRIETSGPMPLVDILRIGIQVAAGLAAAHEQGLVHRDIKPANILLEEGVERVTITDFGLARAVDDASMTRSGVITGTPQYMSPEQARGELVDTRSDLFSLGSLMYAMCTGHSPFRAETSYGVLHRITHDEVRPIRTSNSNIPMWLDQIIKKLLSKSPDDRFESAKEVAGILEECLAYTQHPETKLPEAVVKLAPKPIRTLAWRMIPVAAGFVFSLLFGGLILLETGKGTIRIESNVEASVPLIIRQGDTVVNNLTVSKKGATTQLKAGNYVLEIAGEDIDVTILGDKVTLNRGATWVASIQQIETNTQASTSIYAQSNNPYIGSSHVVQPIGEAEEASIDSLERHKHVLSKHRWELPDEYSPAELLAETNELVSDIQVMTDTINVNME